MKTALDLPDDLMMEVKILAVRQGRRLKEVIADLLRTGLEKSTEPPDDAETPFVRDPVSGLPVIVCRHQAPPGRNTPDQIADILLNQEIEWHREAGR